MDNIHKAYELAKNVLRSNYKAKGIYAGQRHFDDYWARDSFFSCLGALELNDYSVVKKNLLLFIKYQKENGQLPFRIGDYNIISKFIGIKKELKKELKARYKEDKNASNPLDTGSLFVIVAYEYIKRTKDLAFAKKYFKNFESAIKWTVYHDKNKNYLVEEGPYSSWDDSLKFRGETAYTNVCFYNAIFSLSKIAFIIKDKKNEEYYRKNSEKIEEKINKILWNGNYYSSYSSEGKRHDYFSTSGNLLAIFWNIADKKKAIKIEKSAEKFCINKYVPSLTNYPKYPVNLIYPPFYLVGMQDYHNYGMCWLWLGCLDVIAKQKTGLKKESEQLLKRIADKIVEYDDVYEVYEKNGKPVNRLFYKSEHHFSWSSAMFILAFKSVVN